MKGEFSIVNKTSAVIPRLPFLEAKDDILGEGYSLSLAFITEQESQKINREYRGRDYPTNVLSFPFSKKSGEILICPKIVAREAKEKKFASPVDGLRPRDKNFTELIGFLVIHGMLHLKGMTHSSRIDTARMEKAEEKYDQKHFGGHRRRIVHDTSRGRRILKGRKKS